MSAELMSRRLLQKRAAARVTALDLAVDALEQVVGGDNLKIQTNKLV